MHGLPRVEPCRCTAHSARVTGLCHVPAPPPHPALPHTAPQGHILAVVSRPLMACDPQDRNILVRDMHCTHACTGQGRPAPAHARPACLCPSPCQARPGKTVCRHILFACTAVAAHVTPTCDSLTLKPPQTFLSPNLCVHRSPVWSTTSSGRLAAHGLASTQRKTAAPPRCCYCPWRLLLLPMQQPLPSAAASPTLPLLLLLPLASPALLAGLPPCSLPAATGWPRVRRGA